MKLFDIPEGTKEDESIARYNKARDIQVWYRAGFMPFFLHRLRGPALIYIDGKEEWYRNDDEYTPTAHELMLWNIRKAHTNYQISPMEQ